MSEVRISKHHGTAREWLEGHTPIPLRPHEQDIADLAALLAHTEEEATATVLRVLGYTALSITEEAQNVDHV